MTRLDRALPASLKAFRARREEKAAERAHDEARAFYAALEAERHEELIKAMMEDDHEG